MAEGKNKIIVYKDWIGTFESLTDEEAGKLIKHFFRYVNDLNPEAPDRITTIAFEPLKQTLKRDLARYLETCVKNRDNVKNKWGKELCQINSNKRSERLRDARAKGTHSNEDWIEIVKYFGECVKCGSTDKLVKDHIIPIYQGGSDGLDNLQPLCAKCNSSKGPDNTDYRISFCLEKGIKMPTKCLRNASKPADNDSDSDRDIKYIYNAFYDSQIANCTDESYLLFIRFLFGENDLGRPFNKLLRMDDQINYKRFLRLRETSEQSGKKIFDTCRELENYTKKSYSSLYLTLNKWLKNVR